MESKLHGGLKMDWWIVDLVGRGRRGVFSGRQDGRWVPLIFTSRERVAEYVNRYKPSWATVTAGSFDPLGEDEFLDFLSVALTHRFDRRTHFAVDPPPNGGRFRACPIAQFLSDPGRA
jgi:hypothetical protein